MADKQVSIDSAAPQLVPGLRFLAALSGCMKAEMEIKAHRSAEARSRLEGRRQLGEAYRLVRDVAKANGPAAGAVAKAEFVSRFNAWYKQT